MCFKATYLGLDQIIFIGSEEPQLVTTPPHPPLELSHGLFHFHSLSLTSAQK